MSSEIVNYHRRLEIDPPKGQTVFLWGPRKAGKSTYLKERFSNAMTYDLLKSDVYLRFAKKPSDFREEILALSETKLQEPIIIDEVQKIPLLLDEIHWLIENSKAYFILCGSSARKLKRGAANLLGGRAWRFEMFPLSATEIPDFDLLTALNKGLLPSHYQSAKPMLSLQSYVIDYLKEEIQEEGLTRNLPAFSSFLDALGFTTGELVNYSNISRDCGVDSKTVKEYFQILEDTLIGTTVYPFRKRVQRDIIVSTPKFYLFDVGVAGYLAGRTLNTLKGSEAGKAFEHFVFMEIAAFKGTCHKRFEIQYWRTKQGYEVDFILVAPQKIIPIEVKVSDHVAKQDLKGLVAFMDEHDISHGIVVSRDPRPRVIQLSPERSILVTPFMTFVSQLWNHDII